MIDLKDYSKKYSQQYKKKFSFERVLIKSRRERVLTSVKKHTHKNILEIGCGLDPIFQFCEDYDHYTVVEPSSSFAEHAQKLAQGKDGITILSGYLEDVYGSLAGKPEFDFIIMSGILHEVSDPNRLLHAINEVCQVETVVHINVPNVRSFHRLLAYEMGLIRSLFEKSEMEKKFQRNTRFDKETLFKIVEKNGFRVISFGTYFIKPFKNSQIEKIVEKNIVDISFLEGLEKLIKYMPEMGSEMYVDVKKK